jgi:sortase (surface protein transpeptidase)
MSQLPPTPKRVSLDGSGLRSRLRVTPINHRSSSYQPRTRASVTVPKPTADFAVSKHHPKPAVSRRASSTIEQLIVYHPKAKLEVARKKPAPRHAPQPTSVLARSYVKKPFAAPARKRFQFVGLSQAKIVMAMAICVFVVGMSVSVMGFYANRIASAQSVQASLQVDKAAAVAKPTDTASADPDAPSTTPVSSQSIRSYAVAPDLARYIKIPKLDVHARVLQVGVTTSGALGAPGNVFDAAWYTGSAKPGQPGASLIDGHVSSWTTNGVFYGIKKLAPGDAIQIEKGDGKVLSYSVVKVVTYDAANVDMQSLMRSADLSKSGLNLITCGGKYDREQGEFTQRVAVYATQD